LFFYAASAPFVFNGDDCQYSEQTRDTAPYVTGIRLDFEDISAIHYAIARQARKLV
jgi:hypothetical protein